MTVSIVSDALVSWALATAPALEGSYDHAPERKTEPLPDVATEIINVNTIVNDDPRFPFLRLQNFALKVYTFNLLVMVSPEPAGSAADELSGIIDTLMDSIVNDMTLGGELASIRGMASPVVQANYNPPFVQFDDGTKGRLCTLTINVGQPIGLE